MGHGANSIDRSNTDSARPTLVSDQLQSHVRVSRVPKWVLHQLLGVPAVTTLNTTITATWLGADIRRMVHMPTSLTQLQHTQIPKIQNLGGGSAFRTPVPLLSDKHEYLTKVMCRACMCTQ